MTDLQIRYFLTTARCLNFTEAAKQLYISQPALSQQITALEKELNMQLFVRMKKRVYLTPAAVVLLKELPHYEEHYADIIHMAQIANAGITQTVKLGLMEGQIMPPEWLDKFFEFRKAHPEVNIEITCHSLGKVSSALQEGEIDIGYLPDFEAMGKSNLVTVEVADDHAAVLVSKNHRLAKEKIVNFKQLKHETIIMLRESESTILHEMILNDCEKAGFVPNIMYVSSLDENITCTELGMGVGISNWHSYACYNPNIVVLKELHLPDKKFIFAWKKENMNSAIPLFVHSVCPNQ